MSLGNLLNINYIITLSIVVSIINIIATGRDILFLNSLEKTGILNACHNCSQLLVIQASKIVILTAHVLITIVFIVVLKQKQVYWKFLICLLIVNFGISAVRSILIWLNIFIRIGNNDVLSSWMKFEIHPFTVFCQYILGGGIFIATFYWIVEFGWKNKMIVGTDKIFGVKIRIFLYLQLGFLLVHAILFVQNRAQILLNDQIRNKALKDASIFSTSSIILAITLIQPCWYFYDVIWGVKQNYYKRIRRFYQCGIVTIPFFQPLLLLLSMQENDIFEHDFNRSFWKYLFALMMSPFVLGTYFCLFFYYQFLKYEAINGNSYKNVCLTKSPFSVKRISRTRLEIENEAPIGTGHSSIVYTGTLQTSELFWSKKKPNAVAIKVLSGNNSDYKTTSVIVEELRNMSRAMQQSEGHSNLVGFLGVCFQNPGYITSPLGAVNIVIELCENGSLDRYLVKMHDRLTARSGELTHQCSIQLVSWAEQVANGMEFLAKQNIIHGDLAARNILLNSTLTAKISDFGMSRKLYDYQIYVSTQQTVFPWRWMAPESLDGLKFSTASDVWSYGVLVWEIFSFGVNPWEDKIWSSDFVTCLIAGERLSKPIFASDFVYDKIMLQCWRIRAEERPTFVDLIKGLKSFRASTKEHN